MRKTAALLCVMAFSAAALPAFAEVSVINDRQYVGDDGFFHIVGEIQNDTNATINQISLEAVLYDEQGSIIDTKHTSSLVNTIMPGMKGPFDLLIGSSEGERIHSYSLGVLYEVGAPKSQVIDIISSELSRDSHDNLMITGIVTNRGDITANTVSVVATLYDRQGSVAAVSRVHPEPDYLGSNSEAFFLVPVPDKTQTMGVDDYSLIAESEEYAAVPEFSISMIVLLAGSVSAYVGVSRYSDRIITNLVSAANPK